MNFKNEQYLEQARHLIRAACTPWGIKASLGNLDNYGAIFTRDAVMAGIAGLLIKDEIILEGFKNSLIYLKQLQGKQGQIASNFKVKDDQIVKVSFGTLSPKIDSSTWYLIGLGLLTKEGLIEKKVFQESIEKTINLLEGIEYNAKHLLYIPKGGNWADEYIYEGYILYDQLLRAWALSLLGNVYQEMAWTEKAEAILDNVQTKYKTTKTPYFYASFYPGGIFQKFDLAAHTIAGIVFSSNNDSFAQSLDWIFETFLKAQKMPPAFYPVIKETDKEWTTLRKFHLFEFKNKAHHYHNGGIWWIWLGWLAITFSLWKKEAALQQLLKIAFNYLNNREHFNFEEYLAADNLQPQGTTQLCYTATGIIFLSLAQKNTDFSILKISNQPLIKEPLQIKKQYFEVSEQILEQLYKVALFDKEKLVIGICGESGSGKSITAKCLQIALEKQHISSIILHQDNYFKFPPKENHQKRKKDINWVGTDEVRMDVLQVHIQQFKTKKKHLNLPIVDYLTNQFSEQQIRIENKTVLIVEGTYALFLNDLDYKIFLTKTYQQTLSARKKRSREVYDPFVEKVLKIEHSIIAPLGKQADLIIGDDYKIKGPFL